MSRDTKFVGAHIPIDVKAEMTRQKEMTGKSQQEIVRDALIAHLIEDEKNGIPAIDPEELRKIIDGAVQKIELPIPDGVGEAEVRTIIDDKLLIESTNLRQATSDQLEEMEEKLVRLRDRIELLEVQLEGTKEDSESIPEYFGQQEMEQQPFEKLPKDVFGLLNQIIVGVYSFEEEVYGEVDEEKLFRTIAEDLDNHESIEPAAESDKAYWEILKPAIADQVDGAISNVVETAENEWNFSDYLAALSTEFQEIVTDSPDQPSNIQVFLDTPVMQMVDEAIEKINRHHESILGNAEEFVTYAVGETLKRLGDGGLFMMPDKAMKRMGKEVVAKFKK
jgi:TolA-binding protein